MSDRRRFLEGLTSLPLATVLANPRLAAAVLQDCKKLRRTTADGGTIKAALVEVDADCQASKMQTRTMHANTSAF